MRFVLTFLLSCSLALAADTIASDGSSGDVETKANAANNGDTITIPDGMFTWTSGITINKAVTLKGLGAVTLDNHAKPRATACGTVITANYAGTLITWNLVANQTSRMTAIEFVKGAASTTDVTIKLNGTNIDGRRIMVDHCAARKFPAFVFGVYSALGVITRNTITTAGNAGGFFMVDGAAWNDPQGTDNYGNKSWAEGENYGTDQFIFFEDNTFVSEWCRSTSSVEIPASVPTTATFTVPAGLSIYGFISAIFWDDATGKPDATYSMYGSVNSYSGTTLVMDVTAKAGSGTKGHWTISGQFAGSDGERGCRQVVRNNVYSNGAWEIHGTEANNTRSGRVVEFYDNVMVSNRARNQVMVFRGGTGLIHGNTITNYQEVSPVFVLNAYSTQQDLGPPWSGPDGRNLWHTNDTTGTPGVDANPYVTGTVTSAGENYMVDTSKTWTSNQWRHYTIRATSGIVVSAMTRSGNTISVTTATPHGVTETEGVASSPVSILGANEHWYNRLYSVGYVTVIDTTHLELYTDSAPNASPDVTNVRLRRGGYYGYIISNDTDEKITWGSGTNGAPYSLQLEAGDTYEINKVDVVMDQPGMGAGALIASTDQTPPVGWPDQVVSPVYQWDNSSGAFDQLMPGGGGATYAHIVAGTHYKNEAYSYTPYTYPHPLIDEETPPVTTTWTTVNLNVTNLIIQ